MRLSRSSLKNSRWSAVYLKVDNLKVVKSLRLWARDNQLKAIWQHRAHHSYNIQYTADWWISWHTVGHYNHLTELPVNYIKQQPNCNTNKSHLDKSSTSLVNKQRDWLSPRSEAKASKWLLLMQPTGWYPVPSLKQMSCPKRLHYNTRHMLRSVFIFECGITRFFCATCVFDIW